MLETPVKLQLLSEDTSDNIADRDDQQVTGLSETELAWLAGFLDADGNVRLHKGQKNANPSQRSLVPKVSFYNTCGATMKEIAARLDRLGVKYRIERKTNGNGYRDAISAIIMGIKQCRVLLAALVPYMVTKRTEAQIVLEFMERRLSRSNRQKAYCERDYLAFQALKFLKATRHLRDYTPSADEIIGEDIVRTAAKAAEAAETTARWTEEQNRERGKTLVLHRWRRVQSQK